VADACGVPTALSEALAGLRVRRSGHDPGASTLYRCRVMLIKCPDLPRSGSIEGPQKGGAFTWAGCVSQVQFGWDHVPDIRSMPN
jgi:hypothetical protein